MRLHPAQRRRSGHGNPERAWHLLPHPTPVHPRRHRRPTKQHHAAHIGWLAELAAIDTELTTTNAAIDRYLTAFERGTLTEDLVADRLAELRAQTTQLRIRRDALTLALDAEPNAPEPATLTEIADHITKIITSGTHNQTKALVEALIAKVTITGPDRLIPVFHIPQPRNTSRTAANQQQQPRKQRFAQ